jgi:hypothetical protein
MPHECAICLSPVSDIADEKAVRSNIRSSQIVLKSLNERCDASKAPLLVQLAKQVSLRLHCHACGFTRFHNFVVCSGDKTCVVTVVSLNAIMSVGNVCFLFMGYACNASHLDCLQFNNCFPCMSLILMPWCSFFP